MPFRQENHTNRSLPLPAQPLTSVGELVAAYSVGWSVKNVFISCVHTLYKVRINWSNFVLCSYTLRFETCLCSHKQPLSRFKEEVCTCSCTDQSRQTGKDTVRSSDVLNLPQLNHLHPHAQVNSNHLTSRFTWCKLLSRISISLTQWCIHIDGLMQTSSFELDEPD